MTTCNVVLGVELGPRPATAHTFFSLMRRRRVWFYGRSRRVDEDRVDEDLVGRDDRRNSTGMRLVYCRRLTRNGKKLRGPLKPLSRARV